eukprot:s2344_g2.t1
MPLPKAKSATNRPQSSTEWPTDTETLEQFVDRCLRNFRGSPDTVQGYAQRMEQVWLTARFQTEEDRMKRGKGPQMDSDPRSQPGYNPFPSTGEGKDSKGYVDPNVAHPLDHRLGAGGGWQATSG